MDLSYSSQREALRLLAAWNVVGLLSAAAAGS
jgi:hypothetical protein